MEINGVFIDNHKKHTTPPPDATTEAACSASVVTTQTEYSHFIVHISSEAFQLFKQAKGNEMTINAVSSTPDPLYSNRYSKNAPTSENNFEGYLKAELAGNDDHTNAINDGASGILLSTQNPLPPDSPFMEEQKRFMELFQKAFDEVLLEKGLSQKVDSYSVMSEEDMNSAQAEVSKKLSRNHEALQLMTLLQIDLKPEGVEESKEDKFYFNLAEKFEKNMYNSLGPEGYKKYMEMMQNPKPQVPGLDGYAMTFTNIEPDSLTYSDTISYKLYVARIHDEVMAELNLDPAQIEEGSKEAMEAVRMIGERIMNDPEGQEFLYRLGLNGINSKGMPSAVGISPDGQDIPGKNPDFEDENFLEELSQRAKKSAPKQIASWETATIWSDFIKSITNEQLAMNLKLKGNDGLGLLNL